MGAGQSKSSPPPSSPAPPPPPPSIQEAVAASSDNNATSASERGGGGGGGGCPMRNADGSYRTMPGFASLLGKFGGGGSSTGQHPPIISSSSNSTTDTKAAAATPSSACPMKQSSTATTTKYDVYSRPLDPTNNMPSTHDTRNTLPAYTQTSPLDTTRVSSTIPRGGGNTGETWTYPSPQMFYNALVRKGKLANPSENATTVDDNNTATTTSTVVLTKEEDMASVVAMHNCMNEATWRRVLQWEEVLHPTTTTTTSTISKTAAATTTNNGNSNGASVVAVGPALSRFEGRPTDLSPKAYIKHYLFNHPLPFDRHDWIVTRTHSDGTTKDVRYVIDYYHDEESASKEIGSGYPSLDGDVGPKGEVRSLLVDVRPAADSVHEIWGRMVTMPCARRGCASLLDCVLAGGGDCVNKNNQDGTTATTKKSEFEPLPLSPSESLARGLEESKQVWKNIQEDALRKKGVGAMDNNETVRTSSNSRGTTKDSSSTVDEAAVEPLPKISQSDATAFASTYMKILSTCHESKKALQNCTSEEECEQAMVGMTVCAGQYMCPLQHTSLLDSLKLSNASVTKTTPSKEKEAQETAAEVRISTALDILSECVANYDAKASVAKRAYPELFDRISKGGQK